MYNYIHNYQVVIKLVMDWSTLKFNTNYISVMEHLLTYALIYV